MTTDEFLRTLEASNLLPAVTVGKIRQRVLQTPGVDAKRCARGLVEKGLLTGWQARQLLAGRNAFFLGRYKLLDRIGKGGMGMVFKAQHAVMDRAVALKVMSHALLKNPRAVARFNREVKAAAALHHPNIITAYDADAVGTTHFLVMEYVDGLDLNQWLKNNGPLAVPAACECAMQAAEGLNHAFHQGMVHRDIKPVNLVVTWSSEGDRPVIKILDMGLARFISEAREGGGVTRTGQTIGTPDYIAPEAAQNFKKADIRADIFSLGCTLYKLLTGRLPFGGENTMEKLLSRTQQDAPRVRELRPEVPAELEAVIAKMLSRDPADRYQTPAEVSAALASFAASTSGQGEALKIFRTLAGGAARPATGERIEADADSSLEEFLQDFSVSPLREDAAAPTAEVHPPATDGVGFELVDDESLELEGPNPLAPPPRKGSPRQQPRPETPPAAPAKSPAAKAPVLTPAADLASLGADLLDAGEVVAVGAGPSSWTEPTPPPKRSPKPKRATWDSFLFLWGGGLLLVLLILTPVLWWLINRESGDDALAQAQTDYRNGAYTQAINKFNHYLENHQGHPGNGQARVQRSIAQLWQAVQGGGDWTKHLALAQEKLKELANEAEFGEARSELAGLLPRIAEGLANEARDQKQQPLVDQARQAVALVNDFVPKTQRPTALLGEIEASLALTEQTLRRDTALAEAIKAIDAALAANQAAEAYDLRRQLVKSYPDTAADPGLLEAMLRVTQAQQAAVQVTPAGRAAETGDPAGPVARVVVPTRVEGAGAPGVEGRVLSALAGGAAYGVDAASGQVLWRRYVGFDATVPPQPIERSPASDVALIDPARGELARLDARTGTLRWRQTLEGPLGIAPLSVGPRVLVATTAGQLHRLDAASGQLVDTITLPQELAVAPAADERGQQLYQFAAHSSLFVLSADDGRCLEVLYTGHAQGTLRAPPVVFSGPNFRYVIVGENRGLHDGVLRVFAAGAEGTGLKLAQEVPLEGHVTQSPTIDGRLLHLVTDRGAIYALELGPPERGAPLTSIIAQPAEGPDHAPRFALIRGNRYLIADRQLTRYNLLTAAGRLEARGRTNRGDRFLQPLLLEGDVLFHVREAAGRPGVTVSAVKADDATTLWETRLATPPAGPPLWRPAQGEWWTLNAAGELFASGAEGPSQYLGQVPLGDAPAEWPLVVDEQTVLAGGAPGTTSVSVWKGTAREAQQLPLPGPLASLPRATPAGLVCALSSGEAFRLALETGRADAAPFQPPQEPGQATRWVRPGVTAAGELVLSANSRLYRVARVAEPEPHWQAVAQTDLSAPIATPLAAAGDFAYGGDDSQTLWSFRLSDLERGESWRLPAPITWGPESLGEQVFVATADRQLHCFNGSGQVAWQQPLGAGPLAGRPVVAGGELLVATADGLVRRLSLADGSTTAQLEVGQPLAGMAPGGEGKLGLVTTDGALLECPAP